MLKNLFISKTRIKVLHQYFTTPNEGYHVRGLVRILNEELNAIRRELINLESAGILVSQRQNNKIVYSLNHSCNILNELKSIIFKDTQLATSVYTLIQEIGSVDIVILTQSFIKNEYPSSTDVDLLFVGDIDLKKITSGMKGIEKELRKEIRYSVITLKDYEFAKKKREPFILNILQNDYVLLLGSEKLLFI